MAIKNWNNGKPSFSYEGHANLGVNASLLMALVYLPLLRI